MCGAYTFNQLWRGNMQSCMGRKHSISCGEETHSCVERAHSISCGEGKCNHV